MRSERSETGLQYRTAEVRKVDEKARTVEVAFSSEFRVRRFFGVEILSHEPSAVRMQWLASGRAPFLVEHRTADRAGVVATARIDTRAREGHATIRFGRGARASEVLQDYVDGIRASVSVGYLIHEAVLESIDEAEGEVWRVTDWEPMEISDAALPADPSVGARAHDGGHRAQTLWRRGDDMTSGAPGGHAQAGPDAAWREAENKRAQEIQALAQRWNCRDMGDRFIAGGKSVEEFRGWLLAEHIPDGRPLDTPPSEVGLSDREAEKYSFAKAIRAHAEKDWGDAGFEREVSLEIAKRADRRPRGFFVPYEALRVRRPVHRSVMERIAGALEWAQRDQTKGTPGEGGFLVGTDHLAGSFIDVLRNQAWTMRLGARSLAGLVGDVAIPRRTSSSSAEWILEGGTPTPSQAAFDSVAMSPKTLAGRTNMTRKLLLQSAPDIEDLVRMDLIEVLALEIDRVVINGSGVDPEPQGILGTTGVALVPLGDPDGGAPTWDAMVQYEQELAIANANLSGAAFLTTPQVRGTLRTTEKFTGTSGQEIWQPAETPEEGRVAGYRAVATNQVPSNLTKGGGTDLSAILFGRWPDVLVGEWGILDVTSDPWTLADSGGLVVRAFQDIDVALRHPESFAISVDTVTT